MDMHFVLNRPHLNDGARVLRVKPRTNAAVNQWWLCDEGRYGLGWIDRDRLVAVRGPSGPSDWETALATIAANLEELAKTDAGQRIGVIASVQLGNEELFLVREVFAQGLGARVSANMPQPPGSQDDFLRKADKNPNTLGATLLGLAGPQAEDAEQILADGLAGKLDALWAFGHDLIALLGERTARELSDRVPLLVFAGPTENPTTSLAHWVLPTAAYVEKDGTFVNCHGRVQRIGLVFPPLGDSREDWRLLLDLAARLQLPLADRSAQDVFARLAATTAAFAGLSYQTIGEQGAEIATATAGAQPPEPTP
jgi:predicted molibdopterin-dependent oxidoreductase YjgC